MVEEKEEKAAIAAVAASMEAVCGLQNLTHLPPGPLKKKFVHP